MRKLPSLNAVRAFEATARHLSFTQAANELCVTVTAVSHQVRHLEAVLGLKLFERQARALALTAAGETLFPLLRDGFDRLADALSVSLSSLTAQRLRSMGEATQALDARHALSRFLRQIQTIWPLPAAAAQIQEGGA